MSAIDEHQQLHQARPAMRKQCIEGGASGSARVENVVDQNDLFALDGKTNFRFLHHRLGPERGEIVSIESDIEGADRNLFLLDLLNHFAEPFSDRNSAAANSHQSQVFESAIFFKNFVS